MGMEIWEWRYENGDMGMEIWEWRYENGYMGMEIWEWRYENGDMMVNRPQNGGMVWGGIQDT